MRGMNTCKAVYCCFHPEDSGLWNEFKVHLAAIERRGDITLISHLDISLGEDAERMKADYINAAKIILLLFTPRFLADDDCYATLERAVEREDAGEALVFRIDLRPNYDAELPLATRLHRLPASTKSWPSRHERFVEIARQFHQAILQEERL